MSQAVGFFTDTSVCIGCKACQVACRQWNDPTEAAPQLDLPSLSGDSYDNTGGFSDVNWRHVKFIEQFSPDPDRIESAWLMMSDVCKHCVNAPCLDVCPTGAILRTEFDTVYINEPACNGCRDCIAACPFGVIHMSDTPGAMTTAIFVLMGAFLLRWALVTSPPELLSGSSFATSVEKELFTDFGPEAGRVRGGGRGADSGNRRAEFQPRSKVFDR